MDRSLYPEGVEVHSDDLGRTEDTRAFHILQRHTDMANEGVTSGFSASPNAGNQTLVDVAAGTGYAPNGELVEMSASVTGLALSDYTLGSQNYIVAVYTEVNTIPKPHETNGESLPTAATRSMRLRVLSATEYDALPETDDNFNNDARDRALICAVVTAAGIGVNLTTANITNSIPFPGATTAANLTNNIAGVAISQVDSETAIGNGTLTYVFATKFLTWIAPGDITGNPVNISVSGTYNLTSLPSGTTITVVVSAGLLPAADQVDTVAISNVYAQVVPRFSSVDIHHRSLIGSGVPTTVNPHGLTLSDLGISENVVEEHQDLFHSNGIHRDSTASALQAVVNTTSVPDSLTLNVVPFQLYLNGSLHTAITSGTVLFTDVAVNAQAVYDVYALTGAAGVASIEKRERIRYAVIAPPPLSTFAQLVDASESLGAGTAQLFFDDASDRISFKAPGDGSFGLAIPVPTVTPTLLRLFNFNNSHYIDVFVNITLPGSGNKTENLTVAARPTAAELDDRLLLATVMFSGSGTGFLGYGFGPSNSTNLLFDKRNFGITGVLDMNDSTGFWASRVNIRGSRDSFRSSGYVGVGTANPIGKLHVEFTLGEFNPIVSRPEESANGATWIWQKSRGTPATPTIVLNGDTLGGFSIRGFDGREYIEAASVRGIIEGAPGLVTMPARLDFRTAPVSGGVAVERMRINADGTVLLGTTTPSTNINMLTILRKTGIYGLRVIGEGASQADILLEAPSNGVNAKVAQILIGGVLDRFLLRRLNDAASASLANILSANMLSGNVGIGNFTDPQRTLHLFGNAGVLALEGSNHVFQEFYPIAFGAGRKGWFGFGSPGLEDMQITNEFAGAGSTLALRTLGEEIILRPANLLTRPFTDATQNFGSDANRFNQVHGRLGIFDQDISTPASHDEMIAKSRRNNVLAAATFIIPLGGGAPAVPSGSFNIATTANPSAGRYDITLDQGPLSTVVGVATLTDTFVGTTQWMVRVENIGGGTYQIITRSGAGGVLTNLPSFAGINFVLIGG